MTWRIRRVAELAELKNGYPFDSDDFLDQAEVPLVRIRDILGGPFATFVEADIVPDAALIHDGDVVIGMDGDFNVCRWSRGQAAMNQRLCLLRANEEADSRFLAYALPAQLKIINDLTYATTVKHLSAGQVRAIRLACPPAGEQRAIADYLDRETADIDELITEQHRLIDLLIERRSAVIDSAVWLGIERASTTPTGIDPAPEAPRHWRRARNKELFSESTDLSATGDDELLTVSHLTGITARSEKTVNMIQSESLEGYRLVDPGDLVINTMWAWMGALGISTMSGVVSPAYGVYQPREGAEVHPSYFNYLYRSRPYVVEMTRYSRGIWESRLRLYPETFLRLRVVVPPMEEQRAIAAYLDDQTSKLDETITEAERLIELAKERRSALITAAVTGQIDVARSA
jgi:type I restriction enzyme, S subunit